jgi:hypothetical protein
MRLSRGALLGPAAVCGLKVLGVFAALAIFSIALLLAYSTDKGYTTWYFI